MQHVGSSSSRHAVGLVAAHEPPFPADPTGARSDTFDIISTDPTSPIRNGTTATAHDDEPKHEHASISPIDAIPQAPPFAAPRPDKAEEPPPAPHMDTMPSAPNSQAVQDT